MVANFTHHTNILNDFNVNYGEVEISDFIGEFDVELLDHIQMAIGTHMRWKKRLTDAVATGVSKWTVEGIRLDDQCALGMWLNGPDFDDMSFCRNYTLVKELHRQFHIVAAEVLGHALARDVAEAEKIMQGKYAKLSDELVAHLNKWSDNVKNQNDEQAPELRLVAGQ